MLVAAVFTAVADLILEMELKAIALPVPAVNPVADVVAPHSVLHSALHSVKHAVYSAPLAAVNVGLAATAVTVGVEADVVVKAGLAATAVADGDEADVAAVNVGLAATAEIVLAAHCFMIVGDEAALVVLQ